MVKAADNQTGASDSETSDRRAAVEVLEPAQIALAGDFRLAPFRPRLSDVAFEERPP